MKTSVESSLNPAWRNKTYANQFKTKFSSSWGVDLATMGQRDVVQASMDVEVRALSATEVDVKWKDLDEADRNDVLTILEARKVYERGKGWLDAPNFLRQDYAELPGTLHEDTFEAKTAKFFNMVAAEYRNYACKQGVLPQREWVPLNHRLVGGRRSPDLVLVEKGTSGSSIIEWKDLISVCEIKYEDSKSLVDDAYLQLGDKANFVFNAQPDRSWFVGISLCGPNIRLSCFTRGGNIYTKPLDLYAQPTLLSSFLSFLADAPVHSLGIDTHTWLQGPSTLVPTMKWDDRVPASDRGNLLFQIGFLFSPIGILGKGTRVFAVKGLDNIHKVVKDCWDPVEQQNDAAIHRKLHERSRDPFLKIDGADHDQHYQYEPDEAQKRREAEDLKDDELAETWDGRYNKLPPEWVKGRSDHVNLKGITVMERSMQPLLPLWEGPWESGLAAESELVPETVTRILQGIMSKDDADWYLQQGQFENRIRNRTMFSTCGVDILWFGTAREMFNGIIGALVGHRNSFLRRGVLHRDTSDGNTLFYIPEVDPNCAVPVRPEGVPKEWTPMRYGMASDWGSGADWRNREEWMNTLRHTGTLPFAANEILDEKKDHAAAYDLQSFFWLAYLLCCNCMGAFNNRRNWRAELAANEKQSQIPKSSAVAASSTSNVDLSSPTVASSSYGITASAVAPSLDVSKASAAAHPPTSVSAFPFPSPVLASSPTFALPSEPSSVPPLTTSPTTTTSIAALDPMSVFTLSPCTRVPEHVKIMYFRWVRPGVHEMSAGEIVAERQTMSDQNFINLMTPYFRQHAAVRKGMMELKRMFMGEPYEDMTSGTHQMMVYPPEQITHEIVLQKLREIRDGIIPAEDLYPSEGYLEDARKRYQSYLRSGVRIPMMVDAGEDVAYTTGYSSKRKAEEPLLEGTQRGRGRSRGSTAGRSKNSRGGTRGSARGTRGGTRGSAGGTKGKKAKGASSGSPPSATGPSGSGSRSMTS